MNSKGKRVLCKRPANLVMTVGAREPKLDDGLAMKSHNMRLIQTKIGAHIKEL